MIEVFRIIVNGIYDGKVAPTLHYNNTSVTIEATYSNYTTKHFFKITENIFFSARIVSVWNCFPNWIVDVQSDEMSRD